MKTIIKLENIYYSYNKKNDVLNNISFDINEGEDIAIIGKNGSGKSTLGKIIISLLKPLKGHLIYQDKIIDNSNDYLLREKSGIVFQNPDNQFIGSTVKDDIAFGLENRCVPHEEMDGIIAEYSKKLGIYELLNKTPESLSGGQKQRVALAGILAMSPEIIVFDEALTMLDPKSKTSISNLIEEIKKANQKLTIIRITHDLDEAFKSDKVIVLHNGIIKLIGKPIEVFSHQDELLKYNLNLPFIVQLNNELIKEGLIDKPEYSLDLLIEKLCK